jgi:hypothetical protein
LPDLTLVLIAVLVGVAWVVALWYLGLYTHPAVLSWQRLARLRGLSDQRPLGERLGDGVPLLRRLQEETDIGRLLTIAGRTESPTGWLLRTAFQAGVVLAITLLLDELAILLGQQPALPPGLGLAAAGAVALLAYVRLRRQAAARQRALDRAIADSLPHLAVMTFHHRLPASEALLLFARCQRNPVLHELLTDVSRRTEEGGQFGGGPGVPAKSRGSTLLASRGVPGGADFAGWGGAGPGAPAPGTALTYERIGQAYGVPMFTALGSAVRRVTERGLSSQDVFSGLARATYAERLAEAKVAAAQVKTLIVVPMGLMIVPVLVLIGAPLVASLGGIFAR